MTSARKLQCHMFRTSASCSYWSPIMRCTWRWRSLKNKNSFPTNGFRNRACLKLSMFQCLYIWMYVINNSLYNIPRSSNNIVQYLSLIVRVCCMRMLEMQLLQIDLIRFLSVSSFIVTNYFHTIILQFTFCFTSSFILTMIYSAVINSNLIFQQFNSNLCLGYVRIQFRIQMICIILILMSHDSVEHGYRRSSNVNLRWQYIHTVHFHCSN